MKKICLFTTSYAPNRQALVTYIEKIMPENLEIFLFTAREDKKKFKTKKIKIVDTKTSKYSLFSEFRTFCKQTKIDRIVNIGVIPQEALAMFYASFLTSTVFTMYQLGNPLDPFKFAKGKTFARCLLEFLLSFPLFIAADKIIFCLKSLTKAYKRIAFFSKSKMSYLPHVIDTSFFKPRNKILCRKKLGFSIKEKLIIFVGRIEYLKGSDILLEIAKRNPDKKFILIGKLMDHNYTRTPQNLLLLDSKSPEELIDYYNAANLCFFPSRQEGIPLVPREAMACGTPAIVSNIRFSREIKNTIPVEIDCEKMDDAIQDFFKLNAKQLKGLSLESRKSIVEDYDGEKWKKEYLIQLLA